RLLVQRGRQSVGTSVARRPPLRRDHRGCRPVVDREEREEPLDLLRALEPDAVIAHEATFRREDRGRSSLVQVMQAAVGPYLDPTVADSTRRSEIVADELLDGGRHTLYLSAPPDEQARFRPLFTALLGQVISAAYLQAGRC